MTVEHETAVAIGRIGDKCQRCPRFPGKGHASNIDIRVRQHICQMPAKRVIANLTHEGAGITQARDRRGDVGRRATGRLDKTGGVAHGDAHLQRHEVDQQFTKGQNRHTAFLSRFCLPATRRQLNLTANLMGVHSIRSLAGVRHRDDQHQGQTLVV